MQTTLTLTFDSAEAMIAYLTNGGSPATTTTPRTAGKPTTANLVEEAPDEPETEIEYETVSALVVRLSKEKGRDVAINFLKTFKNPANKKPATKGAEIAPADYARAVEEATALLEEEDVA